MSTEELTETQVRLRKDGTLIIREDGKEIAIAHFNKESGHLEFTTKENSVKYYTKCAEKIGTVNKGTQLSGFTVKTVSVKGEAHAEQGKNIPKRPKLGPEGDSAEDIVDWMLKYDLPQAIIRYGIYLDQNGQPIRKKVRRVVTNTIDARNLDDDQIEAVKEGAKTFSKAPVMRESEVIEMMGVIARRATRLTFTPSEVVGGFSPDDDFEPAQAAEGESE